MIMENQPTPDDLKAEAIDALRRVAADGDAPAAARAAAARTMLEAIGAIGRLQDLSKLDERRNAAEMTPDQIAMEINRLAERMPKPKLTKMKMPKGPLREFK
jgi:hypothetical protein